MPDMVVKILLLLFCSGITIYTLLKASSKKKSFQEYPDQIKKEFYRMMRLTWVLGAVSAILILASVFLFFDSNLAYVLLSIAMFFGISSLHYYLEFNELESQGGIL